MNKLRDFPIGSFGFFTTLQELSKERQEEIRGMYRDLLQFEMPFTPNAEDYIEANMEQSLDELLMAVKGFYIVVAASEDGEIIGFVGINHGEPYEINAMFIREQYRNMGYGSVIIARFAAEHPYEHIKVNCFDLNQVALSFYRKNGFIFHPQCKGHPVQHGVKQPLMERPKYN